MCVYACARGPVCCIVTEYTHKKRSNARNPQHIFQNLLRLFRDCKIKFCDDILCFKTIVAELPYIVAESNLMQHTNQLGASI